MLSTLRILMSRFFSMCVMPMWLLYPHIASADWLDNYANYVKKEANKYNVPGYAFVFYEQGKTPRVYVYGKTRKKGGTKVTKDTVFRLASVSKTFTALLSAKLVERNQLAWNTSINTLLPDIPFNGKGTDTLELQHIVGQSSGFMPNAYDNLIEADYSLERVLKSLGELEPLCKPGDCYTYQNALFGALEYYFSKQDTSYSSQIQSYLFSPLGMTSSSVGKGGLLASDSWARPHIAIARNKWHEGKVESNYYRFSPAAGVNASIYDMTIYLQALLGEFPTVISKEMVEYVTTERVRTKRETYRRGWRGMIDDAHYGLGWRIYDLDGKKLNYHGGWVKGYRADVAFMPEKKAGYVMLMNAESNMINNTTAELWKRFLKQAGD